MPVSMKKPLYREALTHSWHLAWKHKWLWPLGLFATFLGQMGVLELLTTIGFVRDSATPSQIFFDILVDLQGFSFGFLSGLPLTGWVGVLWIFVFFLGIFIFFAFVATVSQGALIHASSKSVGKKKLPKANKSWHVGIDHFWRLFFINIFKKFILLALSIGVGSLALSAAGGNSMMEIMQFLAVFASAVIVGLFVSFYVIYAACYVVVEEKPFWEAMESAWHLFISHWFVSVEVGLIILLLNLLLGIFAALSLFVFFIPSLLLWVVAAILGSSALFATATMVAFLLFTLFIIFIGSLFTVFSVSTWTYLFMKMHKDGVKSRTAHWLGV